MLVHSQISQKRGYLALAHLLRVTLTVEKNETANPMHIRILRAPAVMPDPYRRAYLIEKSGCGHKRASMLRLYRSSSSPFGNQVLGLPRGGVIMEPKYAVINGAFRRPNCS